MVAPLFIYHDVFNSVLASHSISEIDNASTLHLHSAFSVNGVNMERIRDYDGVSIVFSRGRGDVGMQLPDGLFVRWNKSMPTRTISMLIDDISSSFSLPVSFQPDSLHSGFYYQPLSLCSPFFKSLKRVGLNPSFPFLSFPFFQLCCLSGCASPIAISIHESTVLMDVFFSSFLSSPFLSQRIISLCTHSELSVDHDLVSGSLFIHFSQPCHSCTLLLPLQPSFYYYTDQISSSQPISLSLHHSELFIRFSASSFTLTIPLEKLPLSYSSLPYNSDLGIVQLPAFLSRGDDVFASDITVGTIPVVDSTMRFDCVTVGVVCLLLFSIPYLKRIVLFSSCLNKQVIAFGN